MRQQDEDLFIPPGAEPVEAPLSTLKAAWRIWRTRDNLSTLPRALYHQPIVTQRAAGVTVFYVADPGAAKHILLEKPDDYPKARLTRIMLEAGIGRGLFLRHGEEWRRQRRAAAPMFQHRALERYAPLIGAGGAALAKSWLAKGEGAEIDAADGAAWATYNVILGAMFAGGVEFDAEKFRRATNRYVGALGRVGLLDLLGLEPWMAPRWRRALAWPARLHAQGELTRFIEERRAADDPGNDLLGRLITARDPQSGKALEDIEIRDNLLTLIVAGHETTALTITWALYLLAMDRRAEARAVAEIRDVLGDAPASAEHLPKLVYLKQVVNETMRLYPPAAALIRYARKDDHFCGHDVKANDPVLIYSWAMHRHHALWERPDAFDPDRFSPERPAPDRFAFLPFGAGPRICIGAGFAMMEALLMLAEILRATRFEVVAPEEIRPQMQITLRPRHGMRMRVYARS